HHIVPRCVAADRLQPSFFPEDQASGLAPAVSLPVTTSFEVDCVFKPAAAIVRITCLVCPLVDPEALAAELEHLGHKRHSVEFAVTVECPQNVFLASNFNPVANL